jgi:predicted amidophosphoribosyltransferase
MLGIPLRIDLLQRTRHTRPQAQLNRRQRLQNVADAFAPIEGVHLNGETLLLIDDVATTGATLRACARALRRAGAGDIWALTVARAHVNTVLPSAPPDLSPAEAFLFWDGARKHIDA